MKTILLATYNPGKVAEFNALLSPCSLHLVSQADYGIPPVEETGLTFIENAILKARHAACLSGLPALADDSGLEVDALEGAPGIYSARYAGVTASDQDNIDKLLDAMAGLPHQQRTARFHCVLALMRHGEDPCPLIAQGTWEGFILSDAQGDAGFGYDPVFWLPDRRCSVAELPPPLKNRLSHRGVACGNLLNLLRAANWP